MANTPVGVFLNFSKAIDTVDYSIPKLLNYGVRGIATQCFTSYLSNRRQFDVSVGMQSMMNLCH